MNRFCRILGTVFSTHHIIIALVCGLLGLRAGEWIGQGAPTDILDCSAGEYRVGVPEGYSVVQRKDLKYPLLVRYPVSLGDSFTLTKKWNGPFKQERSLRVHDPLPFNRRKERKKDTGGLFDAF